MAEEVVRAIALGKRYGDVRALSDVTFALQKPGLACVLGPNGAGKTTLLDLLSGLAEPTSGDVRLFGATVGGRSFPRARVGVVLQREFVLDHVTAFEYAELFAAIYRKKSGANAILKNAKLEARAKTAVAKLSGGEAQRLFVAASVVHEPELLLLDEPTAALDPESKQEMGAWFCEMAKTRTLIMTTHDLREAERIADTLLLLVGGELKAQGTKDELIARSGAATFEDAFFHFCATRIARTGDAEAHA